MNIYDYAFYQGDEELDEEEVETGDSEAEGGDENEEEDYTEEDLE